MVRTQPGPTLRVGARWHQGPRPLHCAKQIRPEARLANPMDVPPVEPSTSVNRNVTTPEGATGGPADIHADQAGTIAGHQSRGGAVSKLLLKGCTTGTFMPMRRCQPTIKRSNRQFIGCPSETLDAAVTTSSSRTTAVRRPNSRSAYPVMPTPTPSNRP